MMPLFGRNLVVVGSLVVTIMSGSAAAAPADEPASVEVGRHTVTVTVPPELEPRYRAPILPPLLQAEAGPQRKAMFLEYLAPIVREVNQEVRQRRGALLRVEAWLDAGRELDPAVTDWLDAMSRRYRVKATDPAGRIAELKKRVDVIPVSLALAQGALESAWGTSRFARMGNNIFGKWCFTEGCGIVPARRAVGATHEVAAYQDAAGAVRDYIHHLNSHPIYAELRTRRAAARAAGQVPNGADLAAGLDRYSAKGEEYVRIIRGVIRTNELASLDGAG